VAQLNHAGRQLIPKAVDLKEALSPSAVCDMTLGTRPRALRVDEIRRVIDAFGAAARRCRDAGFDGVQLQAAHGYLISQFLTPHTNRRDDDYGAAAGSRFLCEVHDAVRRQAGEDFPVLLKINGHDALPLANGLGTDALVEVARRMQERGIAAVEVSVGHYASMFPGFRGHFRHFLRDMLGPEGSGQKLPCLQQTMLRLGRPVLGPLFNLLWPRQPGFNLRFAARFKQALTIPVICVGGFDDLESINAPLGRGDCDAVSIGRAMIADPQFHRHLRLGVAGPRCDYCNRCLARAGSRPLRCYNPDVAAQQTGD
jgi:2,4-dienoyl-CoA reductase-like NADH-dependent reductase (Old Yellow Enzyme family)